MIIPTEETRIEKAVRVLSRDGLVVYPTETVYGLGADALSDTAVIKVYEAKQRPLGKPISVAVSDIEMIYGIAGRQPVCGTVHQQIPAGSNHDRSPGEKLSAGRPFRRDGYDWNTVSRSHSGS